VTRAVFTLLLIAAAGGCGTRKPVTVSPTAAPAAVAPSAVLRTDLSAIFSRAQFERAFWSVLVRAVGSSEDLFALNAGKLMMPGSAMKILTAAAAAEKLGWDHRFETW
jgi:D-alanyl-D-alanine carboxypeptidase/D-alanyl-D-alanine-endopeptidase (penicillin-binding protein 4)